MEENLPGLRRSGINLLSIWGQRVGGILVMLVVTPIITHHFGLELIGLWLLVSQYVQHLLLLELGINTSLTRFLSHHRVSGDLRGASQYLSTSVFSLLVIGGIIFLVAPLLANEFQSVFQISDEIRGQVYWLVLLASFIVGLSLPLRTGIGMLSSLHRFDRLAMWETLALVVRLVLVLVCFQWFDPSLLLLCLITFVPNLLGNLMMFCEGRRANPDLSVRPQLLSRKILWYMLSISGASMVITLSAVLVRQSSPMLVGYQLDLGQVAVLAFPILIVSAVMPFIGAASRLIVPVASQLEANEKKRALYKISTMASRYVFSLSLLGLLGFYYLGYPLLELWLGGAKVDDDALHQMADILVVVFAGFTMATPGFIMRTVLMAVGRHWRAATAEVFGSLLGIALGLWLMQGTRLGVMGMAMGISIAFIARGAGFLAIRGAFYFSVSYPRFMAHSMARPLAVAGLATVVSEAYLRWISLSGSAWVIAESQSFVVAAVVWCIGSWFWILDVGHKEKLLARLFPGLSKN